ncbi:hypothetical protein CLCR_11073 [Cladophialophora carrionii]|uniref:Uncharacterized protein n=1 Tax=Cladophialophora carrionii TaxID=86049 RepID=A0A1C1CZL1_9EURO|nr:hypothetical protein CLCR_11073 [Cladophialophora carrionii]
MARPSNFGRNFAVFDGCQEEQRNDRFPALEVASAIAQPSRTVMDWDKEILDVVDENAPMVTGSSHAAHAQLTRSSTEWEHATG